MSCCFSGWSSTPAACSRSPTNGGASSPLPPSPEASRCWERGQARRSPWPSCWPRSSRSRWRRSASTGRRSSQRLRAPRQLESGKTTEASTGRVTVTRSPDEAANPGCGANAYLPSTDRHLVVDAVAAEDRRLHDSRPAVRPRCRPRSARVEAAPRARRRGRACRPDARPPEQRRPARPPSGRCRRRFAPSRRRPPGGSSRR